MTHDYSLTTLQEKTLKALVKASTVQLIDTKAIHDTAKSIIDFCIENYTKIFNNAEFGMYYAFTCSQVAKKAIMQGDINVFDYIAILANTKRKNEITLDDYGAFGDLYEILIRLALLNNLNFVKASHLSVKGMKQLDIVSKKYGKLEIGHNGKTFCQGTVLDYMDGDFTSVIYGVFNDEDKQAIYNYCIIGQLEKAIEYVKTYSVYWSNKYDFLNAMQTLTRGQGITIKSGKVMMQYNTGKHKAFINAIDNGLFESLEDIIK